MFFVQFLGGFFVCGIWLAIIAGKENKVRQQKLKALVEEGRITRIEANEILTGKPATTVEKARR